MVSSGRAASPIVTRTCQIEALVSRLGVPRASSSGRIALGPMRFNASVAAARTRRRRLLTSSAIAATGAVSPSFPNTASTATKTSMSSIASCDRTVERPIA